MKYSCKDCNFVHEPTSYMTADDYQLIFAHEKTHQTKIEKEFYR